MSRRRRLRRRSIRWARYFNHYGHIPDVLVGSGYSRYLRMTRPWGYIREQQKLPYSYGYRDRWIEVL